MTNYYIFMIIPVLAKFCTVFFSKLATILC